MKSVIKVGTRLDIMGHKQTVKDIVVEFYDEKDASSIQFITQGDDGSMDLHYLGSLARDIQGGFITIIPEN